MVFDHHSLRLYSPYLAWSACVCRVWFIRALKTEMEVKSRHTMGGKGKRNKEKKQKKEEIRELETELKVKRRLTKAMGGKGKRDKEKKKRKEDESDARSAASVPTAQQNAQVEHWTRAWLKCEELWAAKDYRGVIDLKVDANKFAAVIRIGGNLSLSANDRRGSPAIRLVQGCDRILTFLHQHTYLVHNWHALCMGGANTPADYNTVAFVMSIIRSWHHGRI